MLILLAMLVGSVTMYVLYPRTFHAGARPYHGIHHGIVIHHTVTGPTLGGHPVTVATIDAMHQRRGFRVTDRDGATYHIGYHYLVQQDGTVLPGRPERLHGAHARGYPDTLGIALVGDFQRSHNRGRRGPDTPPDAQLRAVERLTVALMRKYHLGPNQVHLHRELGQTQCPGDHFPRRRFFTNIAAMSKQPAQ
jgi:N-acetylmuramoyl-L-alanine amidase